MHSGNVTFRELVTFIRRFEKQNSGKNFVESVCGETVDFSEIFCLENQFFWTIHFPQVTTGFISPNAQKILGYNSRHLSLKFLVSLIHPEDAPVALLAFKKMNEIICMYYNSLSPFDTVFSLDFRLRKENGAYIRVLNQNCIASKDDDLFHFLGLACNTDISGIKTSKRMEFDLYNRDGLPIEFPDQELRNFAAFFTARECEIIHLLAQGKSSSEIGEELHISRHTVDTHRRKMLAKSHLCNTAELIAFSNEAGLF